MRAFVFAVICNNNVIYILKFPPKYVKNVDEESGRNTKKIENENLLYIFFFLKSIIFAELFITHQVYCRKIRWDVKDYRYYHTMLFK